MRKLTKKGIYELQREMTVLYSSSAYTQLKDILSTYGDLVTINIHY